MAALAICALVLGWIYLPRLTAPSVEATARRALDCSIRADADCVFDLAMDDERAAYSLTRESNRDLFEALIKPVMNVGSQGPAECTVNHDQAICTSEVTLKDGRKMTFQGIAMKTPVGPRSQAIVGTCMLMAAAAKYPMPAYASLNQRKIYAWTSLCEKDGPSLDRIGIKGFYKSPKTGLIPWTRWRAELEQKSQQIVKPKT
ncbi:MAG: hypothetical protein JSS66_13285 [Armatimonadetes bacterium]|nr:hypothetical protein [Armatimonadota bacterium]